MLPQAGTQDWKVRIPELEGFRLLPVGGGTDHKAPLLKDWPNKSCTVTEIQKWARNGAIAVGLHVYHDNILCVDVDGKTADEWLRQYIENPKEAPTWVVARDTDPDRYKLIFRLTDSQKAELGEVQSKVKTKHTEAVELFFSPGRQVIVLGQHVKSGGSYLWPGPPVPCEPSEDWWDVIKLLAAAKVVTAAEHKRLNRSNGDGRAWFGKSGPRTPCPICGRQKSAACTLRRSGDGRLLAACFHGQTHCPPLGLRAGDRIVGEDGHDWAYCRTYQAGSLGEKSLFIEHQDRAIKEKQAIDAAVAAIKKDLPAYEKIRKSLDDSIKLGNSGTELYEYSQTLAAEYKVDGRAIYNLALKLEADFSKALQAESESDALKAYSTLRRDRTAFKATEIFPQEIADAIGVLQKDIQSDDFSSSIVFLATMCSVLRLGTEIAASRTAFVQPPIFWVAVVGRSGLGKTPQIKVFCRNLLGPIKQEYAEINRRRLEDWERECLLAAEAKKKPPEKPDEVILANDSFTIPGLMRYLEVHQKEGLGMLSCPDEASAMFDGLNQYNSGRGNEDKEMLKLYDGQGEPALLATKAARKATAWQLCIVTGIQPAVFSTYVANGDPTGLFARMDIFELVNKEIEDREPTEEEILQYQKAEETLRGVVYGAFKLEKNRYMICEEGRAYIRQLSKETRQRILEETVDANANVLGKRVGKVVRMAGAIHIAQIVCGVRQPKSEIPLETVKSAQKMVDIMQRYALEAHIRVSKTEDPQDACDDIMRKIHQKGRAGVTAGEFYRKHLTPRQRKLYPTKTILRYMELLADQGLGVLEKKGRAVFFTSQGDL